MINTHYMLTVEEGNPHEDTKKIQEGTKEISPAVGSFKIRGCKKTRREFALKGPA